MKICIIGAGLSGLVLARHLNQKCDVTLFEKSRGVGGRMATRYAEPYQFDHGAQFFTARDDDFKRFLAPFIDEGTVKPWNPKVLTLEEGKKPYKRDWFESHYVAAPKMNTLCKKLAEDKDVRLNTRIESVEETAEGGWRVTDTDGNTDHFDWVITAVPAEQAAALLPEKFAQMDIINQSSLMACFTIMAGYGEKPTIHWDAAKVKHSLIEWIAFNNSKAGRNIKPSFTIHSANKWADDNLERDINDIQAEMLAAFRAVTNLPEPDYSTTHRWRYAYSRESDHGYTYLIDEGNRLAACGDWCIAGRVEAAFTSGFELAKALNRMTLD